MHLVAFGQEELGQIRAVLAGDAGDEGFFSHAENGQWSIANGQWSMV
jgi:hypothetical protein